METLSTFLIEHDLEAGCAYFLGPTAVIFPNQLAFRSQEVRVSTVKETCSKNSILSSTESPVLAAAPLKRTAKSISETSLFAFYPNFWVQRLNCRLPLSHTVLYRAPQHAKKLTIHTICKCNSSQKWICEFKTFEESKY